MILMQQSEVCSRAPRHVDLLGWVERLWYVSDRRTSGFETKLPTSTAQLLINLDEMGLSSGTTSRRHTVGPVAIAGIRSHPVVLDRTEQRRLAGVVFRREALGAIAGLAADQVGDLVDVRDLWGDWSDRIRHLLASVAYGPALLDRLELELLRMIKDRRVADVDPMVRFAVDELARGGRIRQISTQLGVSQSTWTRRFRSAVGMPPKRYQRVLRMERAVTLAASADQLDWGHVAIAAGYYDQAHLANEFSDLAGVSPSAWADAVAIGGSERHLRI